MDESNLETRKISGEINSYDTMVGFVYILLRDHLPSGTLEKILEFLPKTKEQRIDFTNGWMAQYAIHIVDRIRFESTRIKELEEKVEFYRKTLQIISDTAANEENDHKSRLEIFETAETALHRKFIFEVQNADEVIQVLEKKEGP